MHLKKCKAVVVEEETGSQKPEVEQSEKEKSTSRQQLLRLKRIEQVKPFRFKPGQSGNPGGKPKIDLSAEIARQIFQQNPNAIGKALTKAAMKGDAFVFKVLAERAFGKMTEQLEVKATYQSMSDDELRTRLEQLRQADTEDKKL